VRRRPPKEAALTAVAAAGASAATLAWFTLAGALGGVFLTSAFSVVIGVLNHRWQARSAEEARLNQHGDRVRDERRESYIGYWRAWNKLIYDLRPVEYQVRELGRDAMPGSQWRALAEGSPGDEDQDDSDTDKAGTRKLRMLADEVWDAELAWRTAADIVLLTARPAVAAAARAHIALTDQKIEAAWQGQHHPDPDGITYRQLNDAMQADLLSPSRASQWSS
jgi:hypothetical protein